MSLHHFTPQHTCRQPTVFFFIIISIIILLTSTHTNAQLLVCSPLIKNGAISDDTFFSYAAYSSVNFNLTSATNSAPILRAAEFTHYIDTQTYVSGVSSKWRQFDGNMFYVLGVVNVESSNVLNSGGETLQEVLSRKKYDESVSLLDVVPFIRKSTFAMSRNTGEYAISMYKMYFGQGNEGRDKLLTSQSSSSSSSFAGLNGYDANGNLMTMMNVKSFNSTSPLSEDLEFGYYSTKLETVLIFSLGARVYNSSGFSLYNSNYNITLDGSAIESIPKSSSEQLVFSFYVSDSSYSALFSNLEYSTKAQIFPFPTTVNGFSYQFLKFNVSEASIVPCSTYPRKSLYSSFLNTTLTIDWILFGLVVLLTPLFLIYRNEQPLRSRLIVPYLGIVFLLILFIGVQYSTDFTRPTEIKSIISVSFFIMSLFAFIFQAFRYYYLRYLYSKADITVKQSRVKKFLSSKALFITAVIISIILGLIYLIIVLSVALTLNNTGKKQDVEVEYYTRIAIPAFTALILIACLIIDILVNIKSFFGNIGRFLFFEDPLFFRSELLLVIPTCIFYVIEFVLNSETRPYIDNSITTFVIPKNIHEIRTMIGFFGIFRFLNLFCFVLFFGEALVLGVTISRVIRRNFKSGKKGLSLFLPHNSPLGRIFRSKSSSEDDIIESFVSKDEGHQMLEDFARNEFSIENILLYDILQQFPNEKNEENRRKILLDIYLRFVMSNSEFEINLSSSTRKEYAQLIQDLQENKPLQTDEIIQTLRIEVIQNMADTFSRLELSPEYSTLLAKWETEKATALKI